jgi:preprotein translocase subunit SecD
MNRHYSWLAFIAVLLVLAIWIDSSKRITILNPFNDQPIIERNVDTNLGLDLRGGLQVLLEVPQDISVTTNDLNTARTILESRANALGVSEVVMQVAPPRRIVAEFPGISNPEEVIASLKQTGLLEFVDMGTNPLPAGTVVETDFGEHPILPVLATATTTGESGATATATNTPEATNTPSASESAATPSATPTEQLPKLRTVMTGTALSTVGVQAGTTSGPVVAFTLKSDWSDFFSQYTATHTSQYLGIVLDKKVISAPVIKNQISGGQGVIEGGFTQDSANALAVQLRYGSLPVPVQVAESRTVGPTLGQESLQKSALAGAIGLSVVVLFMLLYYRLPGLLADLALITYALISFALFKAIPVVLTLPGIAGFILSIGMAVDANILIFERLKEELRAGRTLRQAIDLGWSRAWPSIRDSNSSTLITCFILYLFGSTYGASLVKGFSVTLALGVLVSLFTAIIVTRTFLHVVLDNIKLAEHPRWFGL